MTDPLARLAAAVERIRLSTDGRPLTGLRHDDADDEFGTIASDDAHGFDPMPLLTAFHRYGASVVVIGQVAGILHGSLELTGDLDLLWSGAPAEATAMSAAFASVGARLVDGDGRPTDSLAGAKVAFHSAAASGDCCTPALPWGTQDVAAYLTRCEVVSAPGVVVRYLALDDLIAMRLAAGRIKDLRRAAELRSGR